MDRFRVRYTELFAYNGHPFRMDMGIVWRGENFPTPDEAMDAVQDSREGYGLSYSNNTLLTVEERRTLRFLGKTASLPLWKEVDPGVARALMLLNEPEF